jgi:D-beta-D-heptose 7-phosphate kinase/D-beta-D-heptose 1-phosphate adenosyltransferase
MSNKIKELAELKQIIADLKLQGERIVFTNGCFDILHLGHISYLRQAKSKGDILVVAVNSDKSVKAIKGKGRPINKDRVRAELIAALESVDFVTIFSETTPLKTIMALRPDVLVKGSDWKIEEVVGKDFVLSYGGEVTTVPYLEGYSTKAIIKRIKEG